MLSRRNVLATGVGIGAGLVTAACSGSDKSPKDGAEWSSSGATPSPSASEAPAAAIIAVNPAHGAKNVSPKQVIEVRAEAGTLASVAVTGAGKAVAGEFDTEKRVWRSTGTLKYDKTYTVTVTGADDAGAPVEHKASFATLKPTKTAGVFFQASAVAAIKRGDTYGVGQPVIVRFGRAVKDKAAAEKAMEVVTEPAVEGRWRWMDSSTAHWRPAKYWTPGTKITVRVKGLGLHLGKGVYASSDASTDFRIGPSRIAIADGKTKRMKCYINGKLVRDIPISMGKGGSAKTSTGGTVNYTTRSGARVIMTKEPTHRMTSASYGITDPKHPEFYDEVIKLCCRITYGGEFVHMADWNIPAHGRRNTSHGCINVGPSNAKWFFDTFQLGDVVDVRNTSRKMLPHEGIGDWLIPWAEW